MSKNLKGMMLFSEWNLGKNIPGREDSKDQGRSLPGVFKEWHEEAGGEGRGRGLGREMRGSGGSDHIGSPKTL